MCESLESYQQAAACTVTLYLKRQKPVDAPNCKPPAAVPVHQIKFEFAVWRQRKPDDDGNKFVTYLVHQSFLYASLVWHVRQGLCARLRLKCMQ